MSRFLRDLVRAAGWHRRLLASLAAAAAVYFTVTAVSPDPPPTVAVLAAARDLPGGAVPGAGDLRTIRLSPDVVPHGAVRPGTPLGSRTLSGPVRAGEALTDARFLAPGLVRRHTVAYPVRIDDAEAVALLRVGDRVDVLAASATVRRDAARVAAAVPVLALPAPASGASRGALVVLSVVPETAADLAQAAVNSRLSLALTGERG
jgi:Flp pilus assembly protein CpaB